VRFLPAPGYERDMLGGKFSGSNALPTECFEVLAEIKIVPPAGQWSELEFDGRRPHRWIRYEAPPMPKKKQDARTSTILRLS